MAPASPADSAGSIAVARFATFRWIYLPTAGELRGAGFDLLPTGMRPHFTVRLNSGDDGEAAAVCQVVDLAPAGDGTIVHLRLLPGLVDDYRDLVNRALAG